MSFIKDDDQWLIDLQIAEWEAMTEEEQQARLAADEAEFDAYLLKHPM